MDASGRRERRRCRRSRQRAVDKEQGRGAAQTKRAAADDTADDAAEDAVDDAADGSTASRQFISEVSQLGLSVESSRSIQIAIKIIVSTVARLLNNVSLHLLPPYYCVHRSFIYHAYIQRSAGRIVQYLQ